MEIILVTVAVALAMWLVYQLVGRWIYSNSVDKESIESRLDRLEEARRQRTESPAEYLYRNCKTINPIWQVLGREPDDKLFKYYQKFDGHFYHNGKGYLITITEDKYANTRQKV